MYIAMAFRFLPTVLFLLLIASPSYAFNIGDTLPVTQVPEPGELILQDNAVVYRPWNSEQITAGSPALIFHMAARLSSEQIIAPLKAALEAADFAEGSFQSVSVVNLNDALWGTRGLVLSKLGENKREHPEASLIADKTGAVRQDWQLSGEGVAVILVSAEGNISYFQEGGISEQEVTAIMSALNTEIERSTGSSAAE
ncbi:YtfJ family protein [Spongiibacter taiwanensis]